MEPERAFSCRTRPTTMTARTPRHASATAATPQTTRDTSASVAGRTSSGAGSAAAAPRSTPGRDGVRDLYVVLQEEMEGDQVVVAEGDGTGLGLRPLRVRGGGEVLQERWVGGQPRGQRDADRGEQVDDLAVRALLHHRHAGGADEPV